MRRKNKDDQAEKLNEFDNDQIALNLAQRYTLSLLSIVNFFSFLETKLILKMPNETFLRIIQ